MYNNDKGKYAKKYYHLRRHREIEERTSSGMVSQGAAKRKNPVVTLEQNHGITAIVLLMTDTNKRIRKIGHTTLHLQQGTTAANEEEETENTVKSIDKNSKVKGDVAVARADLHI